MDPVISVGHKSTNQQASNTPTKRPASRDILQVAPVTTGLLLRLLNYVSSKSRSVAFVAASDRYAGASRANKGLRLLWPALQPVTRWYLLHALF